MSAQDIPLLIISENARSERRISPSWTIAHLKDRLEPITGIPASAQSLSLKVSSWPAQPLQSENEASVQLNNYPLQAYAEIHVSDTRPPGLRQNYNDVSGIQKYEMPADEYESRTDSVLAYKRAHKIGRFNPNAPSIEQKKIAAVQREIEERGIKIGARCQLLPASTDARRGTVKYIGEVTEIPGLGQWIGVALDEPTGKNDGSIAGAGSEGKKTRYFECAPNSGVFVRPERIEVGDFEVVDEFGSDDDGEF
ncbi:hypothetical protein AAFC00_005252 [Neodothiora populina]|uniref:CAP-Gly domain-containing protein n=1 Tax=Neodothiora populina TaxID=2781224 RepID=A0ABR3PLE9_9PEZI